jgi:hypothetical protein
VAEQLHDLYCRSALAADPRWSRFHHDTDREKAAKVVAGLAADGWLLSLAGGFDGTLMPQPKPSVQPTATGWPM